MMTETRGMGEEEDREDGDDAVMGEDEDQGDDNKKGQRANECHIYIYTYPNGLRPIPPPCLSCRYEASCMCVKEGGEGRGGGGGGGKMTMDEGE